MAAVENAPGKVEWFVFNAEANVDPDLTAVDALEQLRSELVARGIVFAMARVEVDLRDDLVAAGFLDRVGAERDLSHPADRGRGIPQPRARTRWVIAGRAEARRPS